jgi:uncharacterized protein
LTSKAAGIEMRAAHFPGRPPIDAYGNGGFRFADMSHRGSILCLPSGVYAWQPRDPAAMGIEDFAAVVAEAQAIEILIFGSGADLAPVAPPLRAALKAAHIAVEPMSTGAAVRTYNVLLAEDRAVAAALIAVA